MDRDPDVFWHKWCRIFIMRQRAFYDQCDGASGCIFDRDSVGIFMCMPEKMGTVDLRIVSGASDHSERCDLDPFNPGDGNRCAAGDDGIGFAGSAAGIDEHGGRIFGGSGIYAGDGRRIGNDGAADILESKSAACNADDLDRNADCGDRNYCQCDDCCEDRSRRSGRNYIDRAGTEPDGSAFDRRNLSGVVVTGCRTFVPAFDEDPAGSGVRF